jgi:hypothetical protein
MPNAAAKNRAQASLAKQAKVEGNSKARAIEPDDEIEEDEDEPRTVEEANSQKKAKNKKADKAAQKAPKLTKEERATKRQQEDAAVRAAGGVVRTPAGKASARGLPCLCGCGGTTVTDEARFISGHDAQFRSRVLEGEQKLDSKESRWIKPFYEAGEVIAGLSIEGGELVDQHA